MVNGLVLSVAKSGVHDNNCANPWKENKKTKENKSSFFISRQ
jgi:hypothetical protein